MDPHLELTVSCRLYCIYCRRGGGEVPERNRAVRLLMRKLGFKATGQEGRPYLDQSGEWLPTQQYICQLIQA